MEVVQLGGKLTSNIQQLLLRGTLAAIIQQVQQELSKISQQINIESRLLKSPEMFLQVRMFEFENELYLNEERVLEILEKASETLSLDAQSLSQTKAFELTRATKFLDAEAVGQVMLVLPSLLKDLFPWSWLSRVVPRWKLRLSMV